MYTYFLLPCIRKELPVVSPVDTKYVRYIATCRNYYVYANTLISTLVQSAVSTADAVQDV